ncbi:MAG: DUF5655 domain-containing protein [Candidatus Faecivicinus sp.]
MSCFAKLQCAMSARYPAMEMRVQKMQISFYDRGLFCCVSLPRGRKMGKSAIVVTFGLEVPIADPRIAELVEPCPNRWTHHVAVAAPEEIDEQLLCWIDWAHGFRQKTFRGN